MFQLALVSVSDKSGLADFLKPLVANGLKVVSTGGTAQFLKEKGIPVTQVSEVTKFPEVMDGRVRTLHPYIHMSLLGRQHDTEDMKLLGEHGLRPFDLVIGNLYPFEEALKENLNDRDLAEYIDIGGPCLLRAAAKNFETITVVCDPADYNWIQKKGELAVEDRKKLAAKVFAHVSSYDAMIANQLGDGNKLAIDESNFVYEKDFSIGGAMIEKLRYGENPAQKAAWYRIKGSSNGLHQAKFIQGKQLSFNNIVDLEAASRTLIEFEGPCAVGVKHANPCGVGVAKTAKEALEKCIKADNVSIFGGIIATNQEMSTEMAQILDPIFLECIVAPKFSEGAVEIFKKKKNLRLLEWKEITHRAPTMEVKSIRGGLLVQTFDEVSPWSPKWNVMGATPTEDIKKDLLFAWKVCAHLKSNAIAIAAGGQTLGLGMGQVNRVDAVEHAIERMHHHHKNIKQELVLASDAFFPFADSMEKIKKAGIRWVIQPGGSVRDEEVFAKAKEYGINMVLTGQRHFYH